MNPIAGLLGAIVGGLVMVGQAQASRRRRAAHEAGHALAAWLSPACQFEGASIVGFAGVARSSWPVSPTRAEAAEMAVVAMAGLAGEAVLLGDVVIEGGRTDMVHAHAALEPWVPEHAARARALGACFAEARRRLRAARPALARVAAVLDACSEVGAREMGSLCAGLPHGVARKGKMPAADVVPPARSLEDRAPAVAGLLPARP